MRTVREAVGRFGRGVGVAVVALAVAGGASACAKAVTGSASAVPGVHPSAPAGGSPGGGSPAPSSGGSQPPSSSSGGGDDLSQEAQQACGQLPKDAVTSSFGVTGVTVTASGGTTLQGGIQQIKCVIDAKGGFRANVVVQVYPPQLLTSADQYVTVLRRQFPDVRTTTVPDADVGGTFQQTIQGVLVDEGFAAKKDPTSGTIDVLLAGVADSPGVQPKLVTFVGALAKSN